MAERKTTRVPSRQQGLALITAMLVVAIAATVAAYVSLDQQVWLRQAQNLSDREQAEVVRIAAEEWAIVILDKDAKDSTTDNLTENWAKPLPPLPVEGGQIAGQIVDAQGRFNINNLVLRNSATDKGVFRNLLQSQSYDPELINAVIDWMDSNTEALPGGAEDIDYLQLPTPYRAANQKMTSVDELRLVRGFTPEMVEKLRPFLTALPTPTDINVNTAPPEVLSALFSVPVSSLSDFISNQSQHPYTDIGRVNQQIQQALTGSTKLPTGGYGIKSDYFYVDVDSQFGRYRGTTRTLVNRQQGGASQVLWHSRRLPADIAAALAKTLKKSNTSPSGNI